MFFAFRAFIFSFFIVLATAISPAIAQPDTLADAIQIRIELDEGSIWGDKGDARLLKLFEYYEKRAYAPLWVDENGVTAKGNALAQTISNCASDGLNPSDYGAGEITSALGAKAINELAALELSLSKALISYGHDLSAGRLVPHKVDRELYIYPEGPGPEDLLQGAEITGDMPAYLNDLAPHTPNYARLKGKLADYRQITAGGGWTQVPDGPALKPEMRDPRIAILRKRLGESGHLTDKTIDGDSDLFDPRLEEAVKIFQQRHGLTPDGVAGPNTLKAINVPASTRVWQMELNMERRRWMEDDLGDKYVFVNLADFWLKVVDGPKTIHTAHVVVGKTYHRTPVFSREMKYIVMNPFWNVPRSIAIKELLPKLRRDPGALARQNIKILHGANRVDPYGIDWTQISAAGFPFRFRQDSGNRNALGRIKFIFPNQHNVYIHDTPSKSLFGRTVRSFSHGCIRVQNPLDLAVVLLKGEDGWPMSRIKKTIAAGKKRIVPLKTPIPVHITYLTAWVNKDGSVHFRNDIYGRDKRLSRALKGSRISVQQ